MMQHKWETKAYRKRIAKLREAKKMAERYNKAFSAALQSALPHLEDTKRTKQVRTYISGLCKGLKHWKAQVEKYEAK